MTTLSFASLLLVYLSSTAPVPSFAFVPNSILLSAKHPPKQRSFLAMSTNPSTTTTTEGGECAAAKAADAAFAATGNPLPNLPIPPPLLSTTPGTWAYDTMSRRVDEEILQRTYEENEDEFQSPDFADALANMESLRNELRNAASTKLRHLHPLTEEQAKEDPERVEEWQQWYDIMNPYVEAGDTWLTAPWMVTEFFVYRRFMEALGYFDKSNAATYKWDPFLKAKRAGLDTSFASAENLMEKVEALPHTKEGVELAAAFALWGNKMDLSIWPADAANSDVDVFSDVLAAAEKNLLHDDLITLASHCETLREKKKGGVIDIIVDNAGFELVTDLALADHLVASGVAREVRFQLKSHPTFVSDAMEKDLVETVETYAKLDESTYPFAKKAGERWKSYLENKQWTCHENSFWVQGAAMWEMPSKLRTNLKENCDLAFVKGDANYRRLLGDRYWDYTAPFQDVVGAYFPCPVCALRTLKAEVGCGMEKEQVERASSLDENWLVNGRFGVVHFGTGVSGKVDVA